MADNNTLDNGSTQASESVDNKSREKSGKTRTIVMIILIVIAVGAAVVWWINYRKYITTDDANLDSYRIDVAPQVGGQIISLYVHEGDTVEAGDLLFAIDSSSFVSKRAEAIAQYNQMLAQVEVARSSLIEAQGNHRIAELAQDLSHTNYIRARTQYESDVIPQESFQTMEENWKSSQLQTSIAASRIESARAAIESAVRSAAAADANVKTMNTDLGYYRVVAPASGVIGKRWCLPGDVISAGQTVFTLNKGTDIWVAVFLEETKFSNIYMGQRVKFTLDAYSKLTFYGRIFYIGDNAASEFSLVPPNNASGNYTKVTQRIPIKISIDEVDGDSRQKANLKLVSGMSAYVKIIKE